MHLPEGDRDDRVPRNQNYESDIVYVTKHSKWILKSVGIWPGKLQGAAGFLPKIAIASCNLVLFFAIIPCTLYIIFEEKDTVMRLKLSGLLGFCLTSVIKYWALLIRKTRINDCIDQVKTDWKQVEFYMDRKLMLNYGRIGRYLTVLSIVFMYTGGTFYHTIWQYAIGSFLNEHNRTIKPLVYPTYHALYDVQESPVYEVVYTAHCMCGYVIYSVTVGTCGLAALFATHACGQVDVLAARLSDFIIGARVNEMSGVNTRLSDIVEHHLRILRFAAAVETILREVCLVEFVSSTLIICLLEYYCIIDWEQSNNVSLATYTILLISLTFNIFILCYIGELLIEKTGSIGLSCFMTDWYHLPTKTIQGLILIMAISSKPAKISVGGIVNLSLSTFGSILKTTFAYLNILRNTVV